ncbi:MAG: hypothetical protein ACKO7W_07955, partial [Elainella sp.]
AASRGAVFHHVVRAAAWADQVGFHGQLGRVKSQLLSIFLYPLRKSTTAVGYFIKRFVKELYS